MGETQPAADLGQGLQQALAPTLGSVEVIDLVRLTAGANRQTWRFDAVGADGSVEPLIVQMDRLGGDHLAGACAREAEILRTAGAYGAPVPVVVASGDRPDPLDRSYVITRRLDGETIPRRLLRDDRWTGARARFVADCAEALACIHRIPPDAPGLDAVPVIDDPVALLRSFYLSFDDPHPAFDLALRWLDRNRPEPRPSGLVHGDFRLGNLLLDDEGLAAVLDWELASIGDPNADLGWLCVRAWRFGRRERVAGIGSDHDLLAAYNERAGTSVDRATLRWWELCGTVRWGVICLQMGGGFRTGLTPSIEMAMIGRRVVENEADMVGLLRELLPSP